MMYIPVENRDAYHGRCTELLSDLHAGRSQEADSSLRGVKRLLDNDRTFDGSREEHNEMVMYCFSTEEDRRKVKEKDKEGKLGEITSEFLPLRGMKAGRERLTIRESNLPKGESRQQRMKS